MKLSAFALVISCGAERCIDRNLGNRCQSACHGALINCKAACSDGDTSCNTRCEGTALDCSYNCPCATGCPAGCSTNAACGANEFCGYTDLIILNYRQHFQDQAVVIDTTTDVGRPVKVEYGWTDIEDSCTIVLRGEMYMLGGAQRANAVTRLNGCELETTDYHLNTPFVGGTNGSCAFYKETAALCFKEESYEYKMCYQWEPGQRGKKEFPKTIYSHDWAEMVDYRYKDQMVVTGGCDLDWLYGCHNKAEIFDGEKWIEAPDVPVPHIDGRQLEVKGHKMTSDEEAVYILTGRAADFHGLPEVMRLDMTTMEWSAIGTLIENTTWNNSGFQWGFSWYTGECAIQKATYNDGVFSSEIIIPDDNECYMDLWYAHMFELPAGQCQ